VNDTVDFNGSGYVAIANGTNHNPSDGGSTFWNLLVSKGNTGPIGFGLDGDDGWDSLVPGPAGINVQPDLPQMLTTASNNELVAAGYSTVIVRQYKINSGVKLTLGSGAHMRIL
jgi:hypothetical protein